MNKSVGSLLVACSAAVLGICHAFAQPKEILIGHVAGYTGPVSKDAIEMGQGAQVLIDSVNDKGGVLGRKVRIVVADDGFKPDNTLQLMGEMKGKVVALLPMTGSANSGALVKANVLETPLIGTIPSTELVRTWDNPNMFHIRASDRQQTERILEQLVTVGINSIAVLVPNNPFGEQSTKQVESYLAGRNQKLAVNAVYMLAGPKADLEPGLKTLQGKSYQALVIFGPPKFIADAVKELRSRGESAQLYALSYADSQSIVKAAGEKLAHGVIISQVMPNLNAKAMPIVREFRENFAKYSKEKTEPTYFNIEGYVAAKLIVEAIRRSKDASAEGVRRGLEQMKNYDLGGYEISYSSTDHQGSKFVDLSVITGKGSLIY
jgi:ABC-type branched-subunit amino acid transport system substrate-binding protein